MKFSEMIYDLRQAPDFIERRNKELDKELSVIGFGVDTIDGERLVRIHVYEWEDFKELAGRATVKAKLAGGFHDPHINVWAYALHRVRILWYKPINGPQFRLVEGELEEALGGAPWKTLE